MSDVTDVVRIRDSAPPNGFSTDAVPPDQPTSPGTAALGSIAIPGYELLGELGRGGMGVVYKALQLSLNRLVALKVILSGVHAGTVEKARFRVEAEAVARLHHPNIVQVYDVGEWGGIEYIAFEYVEGPTLRRWQNGKPIQPDVAARIAATVARAVQHAHDRGIIHRDLKPANVLLAGGVEREPSTVTEEAVTVPDSRSHLQLPKVMDFGLAKILESGTDLTVTGTACGTPNYMAPEQVRGTPASSSPTVDVWGLGAILHELLTGSPAFTGPDAASIMQGILNREPDSVRKHVPAIPRDLATIVAKCLEKDPSRRYLTPSDVADDLDRFLSGHSIVARPASVGVCIHRWVSRNPTAAGLGAILFLCLCGVTVFAVALARSAAGEQNARDQALAGLQREADLREEAEKAKKAAETARDELRVALGKTEQALALAQEQQKRAEIERGRAEENLLLAQKAVTNVLTTVGSHSEGDHAILVAVYNKLLKEFEPFIEKIVAQKATDRELRFDQAMIIRARGFTESTAGKPAEALACLHKARDRLRTLVEEDPGNLKYRRELGYTLAVAGSVATQLHSADRLALLNEAMQTLDGLLKENPNDLSALESMIRVRIVMPEAEGSGDPDAHYRAVLELVERMESVQKQRTRHLETIRAHALNNIASNLTNRDKTKEAEPIWGQVIEIRKKLADSLQSDPIARYELAKCLMNYSNQLFKTKRATEGLRFREWAAGLFDSLLEDARYRGTYVPLMVLVNFQLAEEYRKQGQFKKELDRLNAAIPLNATLVDREPTKVSVRADQANTLTRRAELHEQCNQHANAAKDYHVASEYSTVLRHRQYCWAREVQSIVRSGDRSAAVALAATLEPYAFDQPIACVELAKAWLLIAKSMREDPSTSALQKAGLVALTLRNARNGILAAKKKGHFQTPQQIRDFHADKEWEPIWDLFSR